MAAAVVALVCLALPQQGATSPPEGEPQPLPVFGVESSLVLLDVVARDKHGDLVRNLTRDDFEVYEDGKRQEDVAFDVIHNEVRPSGPGGLRPAGETAAAQAPGAQPAPQPAAATGAPGQGEPAVIAFVFDRLSTDGRDRAHKAARSYLEKGHVSGDLVGVFVIDQALHTVLPFTADVGAIEGAMERAVQYAHTAFAAAREDARQKTQESMNIEDQMNALQQSGDDAQAAALGPAVVFTNMQARMQRTFDRLERDQQGFASTNGLLAVVSGLKALPGRKTIVFFSEGLTISSNVQAQFESVAATANRSNVSVYAIDAGGLRVESGTSEARQELAQTSQQRLRNFSHQDSMGGPMMTVLERSEDMLRLNPKAKLGELAEDTGGFLVADTNDATDGFRRIQEEMRFYYLISYAPSNAEFDGTFRSISVKVKRKGVKLFSRKGYLALPPTPRMASALPVRSYEGPALAVLEREDPAHDFPLWSRAMVFPEPDRRGRVPILVGLPAKDLTFVPDPDSTREQADFTVVARVKDDRGMEVDRMSQHYPIGVPAANLAAAKQGDVLFFRETDLAPGRYTVEAVAYDAKGKKASVRKSTVDVPEVKAGNLALSSLSILKRVEKLAESEVGGDNPFYLGPTFMYPNLGEPISKSAAPAVGFFFTVYTGGAQAAPPRANLDLVHDGQVLVRLPLQLGAPDSLGRIQHAAALPLEKLAPGTYTLKVGVASGAQSARQQAQFVVTP